MGPDGLNNNQSVIALQLYDRTHQYNFHLKSRLRYVVTYFVRTSVTITTGVRCVTAQGTTMFPVGS